MSSPEPSLTEDEAKHLEMEMKRADLKLKKWDLVFKVAGLAALIFGIIWPLVQYTNALKEERVKREASLLREQQQKDKEIEAALREARKPFLERQQTLYFEATTVAAKISTLASGAEREAAKKRFYQLYCARGKMKIFPERNAYVECAALFLSSEI
ncbi:MAG: hypothetical protein L0229_20160, partial [Blastocatellia bacterium]|nr:hypothetical protein [Blastocatellia bacterium]